MNVKQAETEIDIWAKRVEEHEDSLARAKRCMQGALDEWAEITSPIKIGQTVYRKLPELIDVWIVDRVNGKYRSGRWHEVELHVSNVKANGRPGRRKMKLYPARDSGYDFDYCTALVDDPRKEAK